jgi:hypothetical protein
MAASAATPPISRFVISTYRAHSRPTAWRRCTPGRRPDWGRTERAELEPPGLVPPSAVVRHQLVVVVPQVAEQAAVGRQVVVVPQAVNLLARQTHCTYPARGR